MERSDRYILIKFCREGGFLLREVERESEFVENLNEAPARSWERVRSFSELTPTLMDILE